MNARLCFILALASSGTLLASCDSDDPAEPGLLDGTYVAEVDVTENATGPGTGGAAAEGLHRERSEGVCCFTMTLDLSSDADGAISGSGTTQSMDEDGNEIGPPQPLDVTGTLEGTTVEMEIALAGGEFERRFEGAVSQDGDTIMGSFEELVGVPIVFERVP